MDLKNELAALKKKTAGRSIEDTLRMLADRYPGKVVFSTSFSFEDQAITHMILSNGIGIEIFTLDTGRFFEQTYRTWDNTNFKYNTKIKAYFPDAAKVEAMQNQKGPNSFYDSLEARKYCCHIRKVEPLQRALKGNVIWITGLRAEHSPNRLSMEELELDQTNGVIKYNPILHWHTDQLRQYIKENAIPYNKLHDEGFVSIGCAPCTRAIKPGEDFRAGRWWWEDASKKECGLHTH